MIFMQIQKIYPAEFSSMARRMSEYGTARSVARYKMWMALTCSNIVSNYLQGFCCKCFRGFEAKKNVRGGYSCDVGNLIQKRMSAHCMKMDDLWQVTCNS